MPIRYARRLSGRRRTAIANRHLGFALAFVAGAISTDMPLNRCGIGGEHPWEHPGQVIIIAAETPIGTKSRPVCNASIASRSS
jgi:hypothetical protein